MKAAFLALAILAGPALAEDVGRPLVNATTEAADLCMKLGHTSFEGCGGSMDRAPDAAIARKAVFRLIRIRTEFLVACVKKYNASVCDEIANNLISAGLAPNLNK